MSSKPCGMRCSATDVLVLAAAGGATLLMWYALGQLALLVVVVTLHFLLFCNIFRIQRDAELIWAGCFVLNVFVWVLMGPFDWLRVLATQTPLTVGLIAWSFVRVDYHGVFWTYAPHPRVVVNDADAASKVPTPSSG